jgi:hypothetical protein
MSQYSWEYPAHPITPEAPKWEVEKFRTLLTVVNAASKSLDTSNYKIVASATVVCALQSIEDFVMNKKVRTLSDGKQSVGRIGKYKVIRDITAIKDYLQVYRGNKMVEVEIKNLSYSSVGGMFK